MDNQVRSFRKTNGYFVIFAALAMTFSHCRFFLSFYRDPSLLPFQMPTGTLNYIALLGFISMGLPAAAGANLRLRLESSFRFHQLRQISLRQSAALFLPLFFLDSLKNLLTTGFYTVLRWEVLPFLGFSFWWILFVLKFTQNILWLGLITLALSFGLFWIRSLFQPLSLAHPDQLMSFHSSPLRLPLMIFFLVLFCSLAAAFLLSRIRNSWGRFLTGLGLAIFTFMFAFTWQHSPSFGAAILNLPLSVFFDFGEVGGHIWPLVPWILLPVGGFLWQDFQLKAPRQTLFLGDLVAVAFFAHFLWSLFPSYYALHDPLRLYQGTIFSTDPQTVLGLFAFYAILQRIFHVLIRFLPLQLPYENFLFVGVLIYYIAHYVIAFWLARLFARLFADPFLSYWSFSLTTVALGTGISLLLILLTQGKVVFFLRKV